MNFESDTIRLWLQVINMVGTFALGVWLYLERRNDKTNGRVDEAVDAVAELKGEVEGRLDDHASRLAGLESAVRRMPTHADLAALHEKVNSVAITSAAIAGEVRSISDTLRLIVSRITERGMP